MKTKGYDLKNTALSADDGKYISFRPIGKDRFVRGSIRSLGKNYTKETISERIQKQQIRKKLPTDNPSYLQYLIDISTLKKILTSNFKNGSLKKIWKLLLEHIIR